MRRDSLGETLFPFIVGAIDFRPGRCDENGLVIAASAHRLIEPCWNCCADEVAIADQVWQPPVEKDRPGRGGHLCVAFHLALEHQTAIGEAVAIMRCCLVRRFLFANDLPPSFGHDSEALYGKSIDQRGFTGAGTTGNDE
tara:strand:- start:67 stop:486 length:420 start_codon:yes stop_codon:yes gene_type:complete